MKAVVLGMAKGRVEFRTSEGRSGAGKRANSELDLLRLVYAVRVLESRAIRTYAYFAVLRDPEGRSTRDTVLGWLANYETEGIVEVIERLLTPLEASLLQVEKQANALAQAGRGGNAVAKVAQGLAEEFLKQQIVANHPGAVPGAPAARPFGIDWDAWCLIPES